MRVLLKQYFSAFRVDQHAPFAATSNAAFGMRAPAGASLTVSTSIGSCIGSRSFSFDTPTNPQRIKLTPNSDHTILFHIKSPDLSRFEVKNMGL